MMGRDPSDYPRPLEEALWWVAVLVVVLTLVIPALTRQGSP
jgi:hypothetical protein